jgi:hypothetical protein
VERAAEWYGFVTCLTVGLSHLVRPRDWAAAFAALHRLGRPGAFVNGGLSLVPGVAFAAAHPVWSGPAVVLTVFGWALVVKGAVCLLAPDVALRSMERAGAGRGREFAAGGVLSLGIAGVLGYVLWSG